MTPAERSAQMVAAIALFRHTEATKATREFARELSKRPKPWPHAGAQDEAGVALADSPRALSESLIAVLFGLRPRRRVARPELFEGEPASLDGSLNGLEVSELGPDATEASSVFCDRLT